MVRIRALVNWFEIATHELSSKNNFERATQYHLQYSGLNHGGIGLLYISQLLKSWLVRNVSHMERQIA